VRRMVITGMRPSSGSLKNLASASSGGATASAPATVGPAPVGGRDERKNLGDRNPAEGSQSCDGFDKGILALAQIWLIRSGRKPARSLDQRTGHRPLSNPPLCPA
jgi:hypothetical protein